jgi:prevent-host-death family protein
MSEMTLTEARQHLADVVNRAAYTGEGIYLTRHGRRLAAIVPVEALDAIEAIEDHIDLEAAEESYAEAGEDVTLDQLREELRLPRAAR